MSVSLGLRYGGAVRGDDVNVFSKTISFLNFQGCPDQLILSIWDQARKLNPGQPRLWTNWRKFLHKMAMPALNFQRLGMRSWTLSSMVSDQKM
jgi:hypothetical protein